MCHFENTLSDDDPQASRPFPRLTWAMPVDVVNFAASLHAYERQHAEATALRLCHRHGNGSLSILPQEILDHIIGMGHQMEVEKVRSVWQQPYTCFQGHCDAEEHEGLESEEHYEYGQGGLYYHETDEFWDAVWVIHDDVQKSWLDQVCLCNKNATQGTWHNVLYRLNQLLKSHFGLQVHILHETHSAKLEQFLPLRGNVGSGTSKNYTACFLGLYTPDFTELSVKDTDISRDNDEFLDDNNHSAFYRSFTDEQLQLTDEQKSRFAKAKRMLNVQPHYHLSKLNSRITPRNTDKIFWKMCREQIAGCPKPTSCSLDIKCRRLERYIEARNKALAKETWPQLTLLSQSNVVTLT